MPSQLSLRPFDVAVALRLTLVPEDRYEPMAFTMATSTSAVHRAVARLQHAGICLQGKRTVHVPALMEFLVHGVRYAFPAVFGPERAGLPTAGTHPALLPILPASEPPRAFVWPMEGGASRGESLVPLFNGQCKVAQRDATLHKLLAAVDLLRVGSPSHRTVAAQWLAAELTGAAPVE